MEVIKGDLIKLALEGKFDVIGHGCNCFCKQKSGIAKQMVEYFKTDKFTMENDYQKGDINKLGQIDYSYQFDVKTSDAKFAVVNCYTQYKYGYDGKQYLDYSALILCFKKINHIFKGKRVGLPWIGCGLAGGEEEKVEIFAKEFLTDVDLTIVEYDR